MIKLYTDTNFFTETYRKEVFPLLFDIHFLQNIQLLNYYNIVDRVDDCNIIVFPIDYVSFLKFKEAFSKLQKASKTIEDGSKSFRNRSPDLPDPPLILSARPSGQNLTVDMHLTMIA